MKKNDVISVYVAYSSVRGSDGKRRPVLIVNTAEHSVFVYRITSKYTQKSEWIQSCYYPIEKWREIGLNQPYYVDTKTALEIMKKDLGIVRWIGSLDDFDVGGLAEFLKRRRK